MHLKREKKYPKQKEKSFYILLKLAFFIVVSNLTVTFCKKLFLTKRFLIKINPDNYIIYLKARAKFVSGPMAIRVSSFLYSLASLVIALTACSSCRNRLVSGSSVKTLPRPSAPWKFEPSRSCSRKQHTSK